MGMCHSYIQRPDDLSEASSLAYLAISSFVSFAHCFLQLCSGLAISPIPYSERLEYMEN